MLQEIEKLETNVKLPSYDITHPYFNVLDDIVDYTKTLSNERQTQSPKLQQQNNNASKFLFDTDILAKLKPNVFTEGR